MKADALGQWRCPELELAPLRAMLAAQTAQAAARLDAGVAGMEGAGALGRDLARGLCRGRDALLGALRDALADLGIEPPEAAVYATGDYGRGVVCPRSDVDLLLIHGEVDREAMARWSAAFQTALRDLGLKVGLAQRTLAQCLELGLADPHVGSSMLDARLLWGAERFAALRAAQEGAPQGAPVDRRAGDLAESGGLAGLMARALASVEGGRAFATLLRGECRARHARYGQTVYLLEPDVKQGRGGLRDLQATLWAARVLHKAGGLQEAGQAAGAHPGEVERLDEAVGALLRSRVALHLMAGRFANDRLTFEMQVQIAARLGFEDSPGPRPLLAVERFMRHFYASADLTARLCLQWQDLWLLPSPDLRPAPVSAGLCVRQGHVDLLRKADLTPDHPSPPEPEGVPGSFGGPDLESLREISRAQLRQNPIGVYEAALDLGLPLHPVAEAHMARAALLLEDAHINESWGRSLRRVLCAVDGADELVGSLARSGLLARALPQFGPITALGTHDIYHAYTVDAHLLRSLEQGGALLRGQWRASKPLGAALSEMAARMPDHRREVWLLACLLHDVGKGRQEDHSEAGERLAAEIGPALHLSARQTAHLQILIRHHLLMPRISQRRDLNDINEIHGVARVVRTIPALEDLTLLAAVDMEAVGPGNLNAWKAGLLLDLHARVRQVLEGGLESLQTDAALAEVRRGIEGALADAGVALEGATREGLDRFVDRVSSSYLLSTPVEALARHFGVFVSDAPVAIGVTQNEEADATEVSLGVDDRPGLLVTVAGVLSAHGLNILTAQINTHSTGRALDVFVVQTDKGQGLRAPDRIARLQDDLRRAVSGQVSVEALLSRRRSGLPQRPSPQVETRARVDPDSGSRYTIIEVKSRDRVGLLWTIARCLHECGAAVHFAKIVTEGDRAIDTFYVERRGEGRRLSGPEAERLCARLEERLGRSDVD